MKKTEKIILPIILKYYRIPEKNDKSMPYFECAYCLGESNRGGGGFIDENGAPQQICEVCAIRQYKKFNGFKTLKAAKEDRRRMFDVGYLFNEMVIDIYMELKNIKAIEKCRKADSIFIRATELFNCMFSKEEKIELQKIESQEDIEKKFKIRLASVDFNKFFLGL